MMQTLFLLIILGYGFGALVAMISGRGALGRDLVALGAVIGAAAGIALGATVMISNSPFALSLPELLPVAGGLALATRRHMKMAAPRCACWASC
jgi:hypothetical protein